MTITYNLAPIPKWFIADLTGKPLGAGTMKTFSSLDKTLQKFVFQDAGGSFPWPDPVLFDENGSQGPFYWQFDSSKPTDLYYLEVYDSAGVLQWTIDNYAPVTGSGGSVITSVVSIQNMLVNNVFWRNIGVSANPVNATFLKLCPGAHAGFANNAANTAGTYTGPDVCFIKNNTAANDVITFNKFTLGSTALNGDVTPEWYLNYTCGNTPAGETIKCVQFPVVKNVQNLNNNSVMFTIWARCNSGANTLDVRTYQFFGDGVGASTPVNLSQQTLNLTSSWAQYTISGTVPGVSGKTLGSSGACGNDGLFVQIGFPLGQATNIDFVKPCMFLGTAAPSAQFSSYDEIDAVINSPRTGYITQGYDLVAPRGYLLMDDLTIGSGASGATSNGGIGAGPDVFPLYCALWNNISNPSGNTLCPVTGGIGASAVADFIANKTITLQAALGRALASAGTGSGLTARALGSIVGAENNNSIINHVHTLGAAQTTRTLASNGNRIAVSGDAQFGTLASVQTDNPVGGVTNFSVMQPSSFMNFFIKL